VRVIDRGVNGKVFKLNTIEQTAAANAHIYHNSPKQTNVIEVVRVNGKIRNLMTLGNVVFRVGIAGETACKVGAFRAVVTDNFQFLAFAIDVVDKAVLAEAVWGDHADQSDDFQYVYAQMKNLRRKLSDAGADIEIKAVYGFGYKLIAP
jgi:hypothetical protein